MVMENDIFRAGVRPGAPTTEDEVKILLCYVLSSVEKPMSADQLYDALSSHELINYFELVCALEKLTQSGHLLREASETSGQMLYGTTELGGNTGKVLERDLPFAVREKAVSACGKLLQRQQRLREVKISETPSGGGFMLELTIPDEDRPELLTLRVFAPTRRECDLLKRNFLNAPLTVYKGVMALLSGNERVLGEIFTREQKLF